MLSNIARSAMPTASIFRRKSWTTRTGTLVRIVPLIDNISGIATSVKGMATPFFASFKFHEIPQNHPPEHFPKGENL